MERLAEFVDWLKGQVAKVLRPAPAPEVVYVPVRVARRARRR
jgi:hypothetical protein